MRYPPKPYGQIYGPGNAAFGTEADSRTCASMFKAIQIGTRIMGVKFYTGQSSALDYKVSLWDYDQIEIRTKTENLAGIGYKEILFDSPYVITGPDMVKMVLNGAYNFKVSVFETSGNISRCYSATALPDCSPGQLYVIDSEAYWDSGFSGGDSYPDNADAWRHYPVDPILEIPDSIYECMPFIYKYGADNPTVTVISGNRTVGGRFYIKYSATIHGIRFYTAISGAHTIRAKLYRPGDIFAVSVDKVCSGAGLYDAIFASPYVVPDADIQNQGISFTMSLWETSGTSYTAAAVESMIGNSDMGRALHYWESPKYGEPGDARPWHPERGGLAYHYPMDPIVEATA